jgi:UDP-glucose 4-epimerase
VPSILVTGAAGFVGSHFARAAHDAGLRVVAVDDLSTTSAWPRLPETIECVVGDVGDRALVARLVSERDVGTIVHFAGRIRVDESVREPALYFDQNLARTITLLDAATASSSRALSFVLSSSAAMYGQAERSPIVELAKTILSHTHLTNRHREDESIHRCLQRKRRTTKTMYSKAFLYCCYQR